MDRALGLRSLHEFVKLCWHVIEPGVPFTDNWHIRLVCEYLEKNFRGEIPKLVINQPPGTSKSTIVSVLFMCWAWVQEPGHKFFSASFDRGNVLRDAQRCIDLVTSDFFRARWGDRVSINTRNLAVLNFATHGAKPEDGVGQRYSSTVGGPVTGKHFDTHVYDDPHKPLAVSKVTLANVKKWYRGTVANRFRNLKRKRQILIMQRLHDDDMAGFLEKEDGFYVVRLPMRYEMNGAAVGDPRTQEGELLCPERIPEYAVAALERSMGSMESAAQLQQRPVPEGGDIFKREWFRFYKGVPARFDQIIQSWDCTFKDENASSSYVVGQVWGRRGAEFYLLDQVRARMGFVATLMAIKALSAKWRKAVKKLIEDKANGPAVESSLRKTMPGIVMVNPLGGKIARANSCSPLFEAGNVFLPDPEIAPWIGDYMAEFMSFPRGSNDDQVDCTSQALCHLVSRSTNIAAALEKLASGEVMLG